MTEIDREGSNPKSTTVKIEGYLFRFDEEDTGVNPKLVNYKTYLRNPLVFCRDDWSRVIGRTAKIELDKTGLLAVVFIFDSVYNNLLTEGIKVSLTPSWTVNEDKRNCFGAFELLAISIIPVR